MRPRSVNHTVFWMTAGFVIAAAGYAWVATTEPERVLPTSGMADPDVAATSIGEEKFNARCQRCHDIDEASELLQLEQPGNDRERLAQLDRHRKADAAENEAILSFLQQQARVTPTGE